MEMSEQDWNDIIVKEIDSKMTNMVETNMMETEKQRLILKFSQVLEDIFERRLQEIKPSDMDYCHMQNLLNFIKTRQWKKMGRYVEKVNETYFTDYVQHLLNNAKEELYQRLLMDEISYKINTLDPWESLHNLLAAPLKKVFKLLERKRYDEIDGYIDSVNFFREEIDDHKQGAKVEWKKILTHHPLSSIWLCNEREPGKLRAPPPLAPPKISYPPNE